MKMRSADMVTSERFGSTLEKLTVSIRCPLRPKADIAAADNSVAETTAEAQIKATTKPAGRAALSKSRSGGGRLASACAMWSLRGMG
jgi:hypothetical protein